jgi:hypothetical protein
MSIPQGWRDAIDPRPSPAVFIDIEYNGVVQVDKSLRLPCEVVTLLCNPPKNQQRCSCKSRNVAASWTRRDSLHSWIGRLPSAFIESSWRFCCCFSVLRDDVGCDGLVCAFGPDLRVTEGSVVLHFKLLTKPFRSFASSEAVLPRQCCS